MKAYFKAYLLGLVVCAIFVVGMQLCILWPKFMAYIAVALLPLGIGTALLGECKK